VTRNAGATFAVPSEDEWYKAAYHQPAGQGGDTDDYWSYPSQANAAPTPEAPPGGSNSANFLGAVGTTTAGAAYANAPSFYGTFDQAGNVEEWIETIPLAGARIIRGGSFNDTSFSISSANSLPFLPGNEGFPIGFRVAKP
jgi:formylglycine-generating enzyme required for sulfatase activity